MVIAPCHHSGNIRCNPVHVFHCSNQEWFKFRLILGTRFCILINVFHRIAHPCHKGHGIIIKFIKSCILWIDNDSFHVRVIEDLVYIIARLFSRELNTVFLRIDSLFINAMRRSLEQTVLFLDIITEKHSKVLLPDCVFGMRFFVGFVDIPDIVSLIYLHMLFNKVIQHLIVCCFLSFHVFLLSQILFLFFFIVEAGYSSSNLSDDWVFAQHRYTSSRT